LLLNWTKRELRCLDLRAKKGLGQNFLVDHGALNKIVAAAGLASSDTVIEVGAGLGTLTRELAKKAGRILAVEVDARMVEALRASLADVSNVEIVNADILKCPPASLLGSESRYKVVGALPYNIGTAVLRHFLEAQPRPQLMVVVLQKEVAQAIAAAPGDMGILSVSVQFYGRPRIAGYIPARGFYPSPKVESAILRIEVYDQPHVEVADEAAFFRVVRGGFAAPRKQLRNSLAQGLGVAPSDVNAMLLEAGIDPQRRAQTLSLDEWGKVYRTFADKL
jgi:16S rRNA (adenine1518-N6/adenine1519-N6)-dimethyltransferase